MFANLSVLFLALSSFVGETRPIHLTVVDVAGDPIVGAEVLLVDDDAVDAPDHWMDVDIVEWLVSHGSLAGHTDAEGVAWIAEAPVDVWALIREGDRSAIVKIHPRTHRNRQVTLEVDRPLRIRTVDGNGRVVPDVPVELLHYYHGVRRGYGGVSWTGQTDSQGEVELPHPRHYLMTRVFEKSGEGAGLTLSAEWLGESYRRGLGVTECVSGGDFELVLVAPVSVGRREFREVRLSVRYNTGRAHPDGYAWFKVAGDPNAPLERRTWLSYYRDGVVKLQVANDLPASARFLLSGRTSTGLEGRAVLDPASLPSDEVVSVSLEPAQILFTRGVVDMRNGAPVADARVSLCASLPLRDQPRDRAAALRSIADPADPGRVLWSFQSREVGKEGRFDFAEPWPLFGGPDLRWFVVAELEGWWRSDPVLVPDDRSPIEIPIGMWHK